MRRPARGRRGLREIPWDFPTAGDGFVWGLPWDFPWDSAWDSSGSLTGSQREPECHVKECGCSSGLLG